MFLDSNLKSSKNSNIVIKSPRENFNKIFFYAFKAVWHIFVHKKCAKYVHF